MCSEDRNKPSANKTHFLSNSRPGTYTVPKPQAVIIGTLIVSIPINIGMCLPQHTNSNMAELDYSIAWMGASKITKIIEKRNL